jgi:hypothetical protein
MVTGVSPGSGTGIVSAEGGSCTSNGYGGGTVQVPTDSRIVSTISSAATSPCPTGYAGWTRVVSKVITDQEDPPQDIVVANQDLTESVTPGTPNALGITSFKMSPAITNDAGQYKDTYGFCSNACPKSTGTSAAGQVITDYFTNGQTYKLKTFNLVFSCSSVTGDGK